MDTIPIPQGSDPESTRILHRNFFVPDWPSVEELVGEDEADSKASSRDVLPGRAKDVFLRYDALASGMIGDQRLYHRSKLNEIRAVQKDIIECMTAPGRNERSNKVIFHSPSPWHTLLWLIKLQQRCVTSDDGGFTLLFRGHADVNWELTPSLKRLDEDHIRTEEIALMIFSKVMLAALVNTGLVSSSVTIESLAQHYGIRTRLLDFTTDPTVAVWFATRNDVKAAVGVVHTIGVPDAVERGAEFVFPPPFVERLYVQHGTFIDAREITSDELEEGCFTFSFDQSPESERYEIFRLEEPIEMYPFDPWIDRAVKASRSRAKLGNRQVVDPSAAAQEILSKIGYPRFVTENSVDRQYDRWIKECYHALYRLVVTIQGGAPSITIYTDVLDAFVRRNLEVCRILVTELEKGALERGNVADIGLAERLSESVKRHTLAEES